MYSSNNFDTSYRAFGCPPLQFSKVSNSCMLSHAKTKWSQAEQGTEQQIAKRASRDKDKPDIFKPPTCQSMCAICPFQELNITICCQ